jgi:spermidine/putrescine transport system permease protein
MFPFFSSFVLRVFGWQAWMSNTGILAWALSGVRGPSDSAGFLYTPAAVCVGLLSVLLPVGTVIIFLSLARIDADLILAARNLGASRWRIFRSIQFPFLVPALLISFLFAMLTALGDVVCVSILGGNRTYYVSNAIQDQTKINNWPMAAVLGTVLLAMSIVFLAAAFTIVRFSPSAHSAPQRNVPR